MCVSEVLCGDGGDMFTVEQASEAENEHCGYFECAEKDGNAVSGRSFLCRPAVGVFVVAYQKDRLAELCLASPTSRDFRSI
jgi:hypothetical protein